MSKELKITVAPFSIYWQDNPAKIPRGLQVRQSRETCVEYATQHIDYLLEGVSKERWDETKAEKAIYYPIDPVALDEFILEIVQKQCQQPSVIKQIFGARAIETHLAACEMFLPIPFEKIIVRNNKKIGSLSQLIHNLEDTAWDNKNNLAMKNYLAATKEAIKLQLPLFLP